MIKFIINRLVADYFMLSRLTHYEKIISNALALGFKFKTVEEFYLLLKQGKLPSKTIVFRHDIDTDLRTARKMFEIECKLGVKSTYYFRLATLDFSLMREIHSAGREVGYHYEEIASFAKINGLKSRECVGNFLQQIQTEFLKNLSYIEHECGFKIKTAASHGDFVNRFLMMPNQCLLQSKDVRTSTGILVEAYDQDLISAFDVYISDGPFPDYYRPIELDQALLKYQHILFLSHPRHWETNWVCNSVDNLGRFWQGICYKLKKSNG